MRESRLAKDNGTLKMNDDGDFWQSSGQFLCLFTSSEICEIKIVNEKKKS